MPVGLCPRCTMRHACGFRQPGTWVEECAAYEPDQRALAYQLGRADAADEAHACGTSEQARCPDGNARRKKP